MDFIFCCTNYLYIEIYIMMQKAKVDRRLSGCWKDKVCGLLLLRWTEKQKKHLLIGSGKNLHRFAAFVPPVPFRRLQIRNLYWHQPDPLWFLSTSHCRRLKIPDTNRILLCHRCKRYKKEQLKWNKCINFYGNK